MLCSPRWGVSRRPGEALPHAPPGRHRPPGVAAAGANPRYSNTVSFEYRLALMSSVWATHLLTSSKLRRGSDIRGAARHAPPPRKPRRVPVSPKISQMEVSHSELGPREFRAVTGDLVAVYAAAMNPPERRIGGRESIMDRHAASPGFRCLIAQADGVVAAFCYGFDGESGQWWHDMVAGALASRSGVGYSAPP